MVYSINITKGSRNTSAGNSGVLKPVNGANGIPISIAPGFPDLQDQFNQMGIKDIRLHDCFGIADVDDGFVANRSTNQDQLIPNVPAASQEKAKTFIADLGNKRTIYPYAAQGMAANNLTIASQNANFEPTDSYLKRILDNDASVNPNNIQREVFFRIGRTLDGGWEMPANFDIYATLVGNIVKRYAIDYQSIGLPRKVSYWEIWNEPDLTVFWNNNVASNYYSFYSKIVKVIKSIDPSAKVGGSAVAAGYNPGGVYIDGFLNYCKNNNTPIDFISWHYYGNLTGDPQNILDVGNSIQTTLAKYGYGNLESICSEWNSTPFSSAYSFSRVQSAQNAAYISSVLMYMQYCKTDRAHYYRADASSFGLFNDNPQPNNTASKSFCSYAGQSFGLFSKLLDETPYILNQTNDFTTGLTTLATENAAGNKMNILAANYKVDLDFTLAKTPPTVAYQQYYLDANRTTDQLNDDWSKNEWFGGKDPNTLTYNNTVTQNPAVENTPQYGADGELTARPRNYTQSNAGAGLTINNIASNYRAYTITVYRIKEGGRLDRMTPEEVTSSISAYMSNGTLSITDTGATLSTVTLYSIDFLTSDNGNCNDPISLNYTVTASANTTMPLSFFLPKDYIFVKTHTSYKLELSVPSTAISNCPNGTAMTGAINTCSSNAPIQFSYDPSTSSFIPFKNNVLCRDISGPIYICLPKTTVVQCNLTAPAGTLVPQVYADASNNDGKTYYNPDCNNGDPVSVSYTVDYFTANTSMPLTLFLPKDYIFLYPNISYKLELSVPSTAIYQCPNGTGMTGSLSTCSSNAPIQFSYDPSTSSFVPFRNGRLYSAVAGRTYIRLPTRQQVKCTLTALPGTLVPAEYS